MVTKAPLVTRKPGGHLLGPAQWAPTLALAGWPLSCYDSSKIVDLRLLHRGKHICAVLWWKIDKKIITNSNYNIWNYSTVNNEKHFIRYFCSFPKGSKTSEFINIPDTPALPWIIDHSELKSHRLDGIMSDCCKHDWTDRFQSSLVAFTAVADKTKGFVRKLLLEWILGRFAEQVWHSKNPCFFF